VHWTMKEIELPLKFDWSISRNTSSVKRNFIIEVQSGKISGLGEIAFNVRYDESREQVLRAFEEFKAEVPHDLNGVESLIYFLDSKEYPQSFKFGVESAFLHYLATISGKSVQSLLGINTVTSVRTSFSIPIMEPGKIAQFIKEYELKRFSTIKVKIGKDGATDLLNEVIKNTSVPLRVDANEAFQSTSDVLKFIHSIPKERIEFLEQPLHASNHDEMLELFKNSPLMLIADESVTGHEITDYYKERFHGVNVKLMKAGGYFRAVKQLRQAKLLGLKTMLGCMVETSLGISSALNIAGGVDYCDLDGFLFLKEDPFHILGEENGKVFYSYLV